MNYPIIMDCEGLMINGSFVYRYSLRPDTLYLNITNRCSNKCSFCVRNYSRGLSGYTLWLPREPTIDEVWDTLQEEVTPSDKEVVWCGFGEPTMRLDLVLNITRKIKVRYPSLLIRLDTDGLVQLRNKDRIVAKELKEAGITSISISLNAENKEKYDTLCLPSLPNSYQAVLTFARECTKLFSNVRLTVVNLEEIDRIKCKKIASRLQCNFQVRG